MNPFRLGLLAFLVVTLMLGLAGTAVADETSGRINAVLADDFTFTFTEKDGTEHTMLLEATGEVRINDRIVQLDELNEGDEVTVTWEERDGQKIASLIVCNR